MKPPTIFKSKIEATCKYYEFKVGKYKLAELVKVLFLLKETYLHSGSYENNFVHQYGRKMIISDDPSQLEVEFVVNHW